MKFKRAINLFKTSFTVFAFIIMLLIILVYVLSENSENYEDMIIGFIYASEDSDSEVTDTVKEAAEKKLEKLDLTIDDLVDYFLDIHKDKGESLN